MAALMACPLDIVETLLQTIEHAHGESTDFVASLPQRLHITSEGSCVL
jgi:hypothetical protein